MKSLISASCRLHFLELDMGRILAGKEMSRVARLRIVKRRYRQGVVGKCTPRRTQWLRLDDARGRRIPRAESFVEHGTRSDLFGGKSRDLLRLGNGRFFDGGRWPRGSNIGSLLPLLGTDRRQLDQGVVDVAEVICELGIQRKRWLENFFYEILVVLQTLLLLLLKLLLELLVLLLKLLLLLTGVHGRGLD